MKRRKFIQQAAILGASVPMLSTQSLGRTAEAKKARLAFIGVGMRGSYLLKEALSQGLTEITAVCDIDDGAIGNVRKTIKDLNAKEPVYFKGERDFEKIVQRDDVDGVVIATPWHWHVPMSIASMKAGKHTGCEVLAGLTVSEIWDLVNAHESTRSPYIMLENVCYRQDVMAVLNMARKGLFGKIQYAECGYQHDLREYLFNNGTQMFGGGVEFGAKAINEANWRTQHYVDRNGDLYPTHGVGPVSQIMNITRGNQFSYLVSMASPATGLNKYILDHEGKNHPNAQVKFKCGDVVTTLIKCANGEVVKMTFDTSSPRAYSLGFRIQGNDGLWTEDANGIYFQKTAPKPHEYEPAAKYLELYDHPYWKKYSQLAKDAGHGGMDYFIIREFVDAVRYKKPFAMDVYDAAIWSVLSPLSEQSIAGNSKPMEIPDFTKGQWKTRAPVFGMNEDFMN